MNFDYCQFEEQKESDKITIEIASKIYRLPSHEVYIRLTSLANIQCFMSYHIFAVWDFFKLLKPLQNRIDLALREQHLECDRETKSFLKLQSLYFFGDR